MSFGQAEIMISSQRPNFPCVDRVPRIFLRAARRSHVHSVIESGCFAAGTERELSVLLPSKLASLMRLFTSCRI